MHILERKEPESDEKEKLNLNDVAKLLKHSVHMFDATVTNIKKHEQKSTDNTNKIHKNRNISAIHLYSKPLSTVNLLLPIQRLRFCVWVRIRHRGHFKVKEASLGNARVKRDSQKLRLPKLGSSFNNLNFVLNQARIREESDHSELKSVLKDLWRPTLISD